jgi:hypothetical protein
LQGNNIAGSSRFCQSTNALGAQDLLYFTALLDDRHLLQVWMEGTIGRPHGKRAFMTEGRGLATMSALSHLWNSFLANDAGTFFEQAAYFTMIRTLPQAKLLLSIRG